MNLFHETVELVAGATRRLSRLMENPRKDSRFFLP